MMRSVLRIGDVWSGCGQSCWVLSRVRYRPQRCGTGRSVSVTGVHEAARQSPELGSGLGWGPRLMQAMSGTECAWRRSRTRA
eukprot:3933446-Rhodomonas_salina.6